jgi:hypothetical protein
MRGGRIRARMVGRVEPSEPWIALPAGAAPAGVRGPADAYALFAPHLAALPRGRIVAAYLSRDGWVLALIDVAEGDAIAASLPVAEIVRGAAARRRHHPPRA